MSSRFLIVIGGLLVGVTISVPVAAGQQVSATNWAPSRTAWGDPDLQGSTRSLLRLRSNGRQSLAGKPYIRRPNWRTWESDPRQPVKHVRRLPSIPKD